MKISQRAALYMVAAIMVLGSAAGVFAAEQEHRFGLEVEGGAVWFSRNDVQIPNSGSGTRFSLLDLTGSGPHPAYRIEAVYELDKRNGLRLLVAPLEVRGTGRFDRSVDFAGATFSPGVDTEGSFKFNTYRLTYRYTFYEDRSWQWRVGFTALVRDARIALKQGSTEASDSNVGIVPLLYLYGEYRPADRLSLVLDLDGAVGTQGRAIDAAVKARYAFSDWLSASVSYRTIEGGADNDSIYTFTWAHFALASVTVLF